MRHYPRSSASISGFALSIRPYREQSRSETARGPWTALHSRFQQRDALGGDGLFQADGADVLAGLALQPDPLGLDAEDVGQPLADGLAVGEQLGPLGEDDAVDVDDPPAQGGDGVQRGRGAFRPSRGRGSPDRCRETSGRCRPGRPPPAGRRSRRASSTSASLWPISLPVVGDVDAAQPQRAAAARAGACRVRCPTRSGRSWRRVLRLPAIIQTGTREVGRRRAEGGGEKKRGRFPARPQACRQSLSSFLLQPSAILPSAFPLPPSAL